MSEIFAMPAAPARAMWTIIGLGVVIGAMLLGLLVLFVGMARGAGVTRYEIGPEGLSVRGTIYGRTLPWEQVVAEEARVVDLAVDHELRPTWRTNGIGLPGYQAGWFRLNRAGRGLVFLTDRSRVVAIPTRAGYTLLLSASDPESLAAAVRRTGAPADPR